MRYLPQVRNAALVQMPNANVLDTESYSVFNLNGSWTFNERLALRAGIDNFLDEEPPIVGAQPGVNNNMGVTLPRVTIRSVAGISWACRWTSRMPRSQAAAEEAVSFAGAAGSPRLQPRRAAAFS